MTWLTKIGGAEFKIMRLQETVPHYGMMDQPQAIADYLRSQIPESLRYNPDTENLMVILLSTRKHVIGFEVVSNGTLNTLLVHPREVFKPAIVMAADSIIIAHNHPSGDPTPSEPDVKVTRTLIKAGRTLQIEVVDHIILGQATPDRPKGWSSLREFGYFEF